MPRKKTTKPKAKPKRKTAKLPVPVKGLLLEKQYDNRDWIMGAITGIDAVPLVLDGKWRPYLPVFEKQYNKYFDTYNCTAFGLLNGVEAFIKKKYGYVENFSDRDLGIKAETKCGRGNYMSKVAEILRLYGVCNEHEVPFNDTIKVCTDYYKRPANTEKLGDKFLNKYKFNWDWVFWGNQDKIIEAMTYSPLVVAVYAGSRKIVKNGIIQKTTYSPTHIELIVNYDYGKWFETFNTYEGTMFKKYAWDYNWGAKQRLNINLNTMPTTKIPKFDNNTLIKNAEVDQAIGLYVDKKLIVETIQPNDYRIMKEFIARNDGNIKGKIKSVKQEIWNAIPKVDLSWKPVK